MLKRLRAHTISFKHAFDGIWYSITSQPNFRFDLFVAIGICLLGYYFSLSRLEWLIVLFTFNLVLVAEMLNTAIESMVDLITLEQRTDAKIAKDVSAGMVLVSAILASAIGLFIFLPKIINLFK